MTVNIGFGGVSGPMTVMAQEGQSGAAELLTIDVTALRPNQIGYTIERSRSATKTDTPLREVPQSVSVITGEAVRDIGAQSVSDAIRYVPGVIPHQGEGNRDQVIIRGQGSTA